MTCFIAALVIDQLPVKVTWNPLSVIAVFSSAASQQISPLRRRFYVASHLMPSLALLGLLFYGEFSSAMMPNQFPPWILVGCSPLFIPALMLAWAALREQAELNSELSVSSRLAGKKRTNFWLIASFLQFPSKTIFSQKKVSFLHPVSIYSHKKDKKLDEFLFLGKITVITSSK